MADTYYKAVRPNGASFHNPGFRWLPEGWTSGDPIPDGWTVTHPNYSPTACDAGYYLSAATVATDCAGMAWPCVLLEVEPVGEVRTPHPSGLPHERAAAAWRVVRELPATDALGPQGAVVAALIERAGRLSVDEAKRLDAAWDAAWTAARDAAWGAAWTAAREAAWTAAWEAAREAAREAAWEAAIDSAWDAAWGAARTAAWEAARTAAREAARTALGLIARDLISRDHYDMLTLPWRSVVGPIHADDEAVA